LSPGPRFPKEQAGNSSSLRGTTGCGFTEWLSYLSTSSGRKATSFSDEPAGIGAHRKSSAEPDELIGPTLLLASDAGSYITGQTMIVDGGFVVG
jgi:NAD(P)-dependent dehydrogenase (short-subunit alcohol dehydrogenase family)